MQGISVYVNVNKQHGYETADHAYRQSIYTKNYTGSKTDS